MKPYLLSAAVLAVLAAAGCADRGAQEPREDERAAATTPAEEAAPPAQRDQATPRDAEPNRARPTTGARSSATDNPPADRRAAAPAPGRTADAPAARVPEYREITLPAGTALPLELQTALSSETAQLEAPVRARLKQALNVDGYTAMPAGAVLIGEVTEVERAGRVKGRSRLSFTFTRVQAGETTEDLRTNPLTYVGEASKGEDATKVGAGAVGGAIVGGIIGGGEGAARGAAIGGAAGTGVVLATRGKEVTLASGADLAASLAEPMTIRVRTVSR